MHKICAEVGQCPEETELIYKTERLDQRHCLCHVGVIADAEVQIVKVPLPLKNAQDVFRYFDNSRVLAPRTFCFLSFRLAIVIGRLNVSILVGVLHPQPLT